MYPITIFIENLYEYLTGNKSVNGNIIRKHSKKLNELGHISFPLNIKNWCQALDKNKLQLEENACTIFDYRLSNEDLDTQLKCLLEASEKWALIIDAYKIKDNSDVHLYLKRTFAIDLCIKSVINEECSYGLLSKCFGNKINVVIGDNLKHDARMSLTELRIFIIKNVTSNLLNNLTENLSRMEWDIKLITNSNEKGENMLICGSVLNEVGVKDTRTTAEELYKKRALDMQLMAQHKYGMQIKSSWGNYFEKLGKASVVIEMLQNKIHKPLKISLNCLQTTNKGPAFIFYNCARISALLKQFEERVLNKIYPELPSSDNVDFTLLSQPEEWEIVYVFLLQFPTVVTSCVYDIKSGVLNLHHLIFFLSNLSSVFSTYYRRVKILTSAKEHLLPMLYARIYLIKTVQQVFHTTLYLLDIEPIKEM